MNVERPFLLVWQDECDVFVERFRLRSERDTRYREVKEHARVCTAALIEFETTDTIERVRSSEDQ